jgi:hypothetical protein
MKRQQHFFAWLTIILFMVPSIAIFGQTGYEMKITNAAQISCNVYEFDVTMNSTSPLPSQHVKLANFQCGILVNPAIIPAGASVEIALVPGSSTITNPSQRPGPEKFEYSSTTNAIQVIPVVPVGAANASTVPAGAGFTLFRVRVACSQPFVVGENTNHTWNFVFPPVYPTKVFGYIGTTNTDISNPASHSLVAPADIIFANGYPDPVAQTVTTDITEFCNLPGSGATISLSGTETGYTYYLYSDGIPVPHADGGVVFGTGSPISFTAKATGSIMSVVSPGCVGNVPMANTISLTPFLPVAVNVTIDANPGTTVIPGTSVTFNANAPNGGTSPFAVWYINGIPDFNTFEAFYTYIPSHGDEIFCEFYPSIEVCTEDQIAYSNILTMTVMLPQEFSVTGGGTICQGGLTLINLSGSETAYNYHLFQNGVVYGLSQQGTGSSIAWVVAEAGLYTVMADATMMLGNAEVIVDPLPAPAGPITGLATVMEGTMGVPYSIDPIADAASYEWEYSGTGVTIISSGPLVLLDFAVGATSGQLSVKGFNYCGYGVESFFDIYVEQIPSLCNPINIPSIPVTDQALVCGDNNLNSTNVPGTLCVSNGSASYKNGNEALYTFTTTVAGDYTISYTGQTWTAIIVYDDCPLETGANCVSSAAGSTASKSLVVNLQAATTYYLWFDIWPTPISPCPGTFSITLPLTCPAPTSLTTIGTTINSADVSWTSSAAGFEIEYGVAPYTFTGLANMSGILTNSATISGLTTSTTYLYRVKAVCGVGDESLWSATGIFNTACDAFTLPYAQNFDGVNAPAIPACMTVTNNNGDGVAWVTSLSTPRSAPNAMRIGYNSALTMDDWFFTPALILDPGTYNVSFWYIGNGEYPEKLEVKWGTAANAAGMIYGPIYNNSSILNTTYNEGIGTFTVTTAGEYYVGWHGYSDADMWYMQVDDIMIDVAPDCQAPTALGVINVTNSSADLVWTETGTAMAWDVEWGPSGYSPGTGFQFSSATSPFPITGLTGNTTYEFYVRSFCNPLYSEWSGPYAFNTLCDNFALPLSENFDAAPIGTIPSCWSVITNTSQWRVANNVGALSAPNAIVTYYNSVLPKNDWFFSPGITLTQGIEYTVSFAVKAPGYLGVGESMDVFYGTSPTVAGMTSGTIYTNNNMLFTSFTSVQGTFTPTVTGIYYIGWHANSVADLDYIAVDNVSIYETPACSPPTSLTATNVTNSSADLVWAETGTAMAWEVEWGLNGFIQGSGTLISPAVSPQPISGLTGSTSYQFYVRSFCDPSYSDWSGPYTFTTLCDVIIAPFLEDFESTPACWSVYSTTSQNWGLTSSASGYGNGSISAIAQFYSYSNPAPFNLISPVFDASLLTNPIVKFDFAYATYMTEVDQLNILYSTDAGATFSLLSNLQGGLNGALNTAGANGSPFVPAASQWNTFEMLLPAGTNALAFQAISAYGNNLYLDNIAVQEAPLCTDYIAPVAYAEICEGEEFIWMGLPYSTPGPHIVTAPITYPPGGCDSIFTLQLTIHPTYHFVENHMVYDNELPFVWQGDEYFGSGTFYANYQTIYGCDSIYQLNLIVKPAEPLRIVRNIGTAVLVEWDPIVDANLYQLRYRVSPIGMWVNVTQSTQLSRKIYELVPGEMYEMQLRHRVGTIWQPWASVYAPVIFEAEVIEFSTTYDIGTKLMLNWTEVPDASSYILQQWNPNTLVWNTRGYYPGNSAVIVTTFETTDFGFRICPRFAEVSFHWSAGGLITSGYIDITVSGFDGTEATFSWAPVMNPAASDYYLQIRVAGMPTIFSSNYTNTTSRFVTGMMADTDYECRLVVRYDAVAWGATSWRPVANQVTKEELVIFPQNNLNVYPNPVSDIMTVEINSNAATSHVWNLYDVNGKLVMSGSESLTEGLNYFYIDATQLTTGLYMMQSTFNGTVESTRIIKQ